MIFFIKVSSAQAGNIIGPGFSILRFYLIPWYVLCINCGSCNSVSNNDMNSITAVLHAIGGDSICDIFQLVIITVVAVRFDGPCGCRFAPDRVSGSAALADTGLIHDMAEVVSRCLIPCPCDFVICIDAVRAVFIIMQFALIKCCSVFDNICLSVFQRTCGH